MMMYSDKKVVCITGSVWTGSRSSPSRMLLKDGFQYPRWFTTYHPFTSDKYKLISSGKFHIDLANDGILAYMKYGGGFIGIKNNDFEHTLGSSDKGVLVDGFGFQEIIAQVSKRIPQTIIFTLKDKSMDISPQLFEADSKGQLHRINVNVLAPDAWTKVHNEMQKTINFPSRATGY
jgi:hypothetical protein